MRRLMAYIKADDTGLRLFLALVGGASVMVALVIVGISVSAVVQSANQNTEHAREIAAQRKYDKEHPQPEYTEPPQVKVLGDFYSKDRQSQDSRMLNEQLYALTDTVVAPNKPATVKGVTATAWGSFGDLCAVLVSHDKADSTHTYNIVIYSPIPSSAWLDDESKNALDVHIGSLQRDASDRIYASRKHASLKGVNYLLTTMLKECTVQPVKEDLSKYPSQG